MKLDETEEGPITVIGHLFEPREPPHAHQCRHCGWPKANHMDAPAGKDERV
jgi:hypothetical protein